MTSIRAVAENCLDLSGSFSVRRDVYGYIWGTMNRDLSLKNHMELIQGPSCNLCLFLVGHEPDFSGEFTPADTQRMQAAIDVARGIYAQENFGIRKLYWRYIPSSEAGGYTVVDGSEATDLTEDYSGPNDGLDVFFVTDITDAWGWSKVDGSCDKDAKGRTGSVMELRNNDLMTGILLGHEVGHYLGLRHAGDITNLMGDDADGNGIGSINATSLNLTNDQGNTMKDHCSVSNC
ncbi:MAG: hypothetical protein L3J98_00995 [Gammaproteobacteria bacterium]|nr:hypothetical protein [Gammaproteobacteria bacterium]MCF6258731.1 hypothetical protein [Gammaproteobacteria bacterium]